MGATEEERKLLARAGGHPIAPSGEGSRPGAVPANGSGNFWLGALAGLLTGAVAAYLAAYAHFNEQSAAISQANELRLSAANQRIEELQKQQREFAEQVDKKNQELVAQADEQQRKIVTQVSEHERAVLAQQRALMAQAEQRERDLAKPDLPVKVWVRRAAGGRGLVGQVHSYGTRELALTLRIRNAPSGQQSTWRAVIAPNTTQVIGGEPGWPLAPGGDLELEADGFRPMSFAVRPSARAAQAPN